MNIRAQVSMVFDLDKCIGCHTCSIACKNLWTSRRGVEYMWWNNVETKPGTGYPSLWEDQDKYGGGWLRGEGKPELRLQGRARTLGNIFYNPRLPSADDYYVPWTYRYEDLFNDPQGDDLPVAVPISQISHKEIDIESGPNWDDDLGGSQIYAANDPNNKSLGKEEQRAVFAIERMAFFYLPRICNHCLNPGCVGACPAGAIYKRGEDGIVLVSQDKCRAWRMCISGCPYKKVYYNWSTGKSEKCILCYPRQETGQAPGCFHSCVGRIRYLGVLLYDGDRIAETASLPDEKLVEGQREIILDPFDQEVIRKAKEDGIHDRMIRAAQDSPVYKYVKEWKIALPLHPEFRTIPMLFYVPSMLPVIAEMKNGLYEVTEEFFGSPAVSRISGRYLASLFSAGNQAEIDAVSRKLVALRMYKRLQTVGDLGKAETEKIIREAETSPKELDDIHRMQALATAEERFAIPPFMREEAIDSLQPPAIHRGAAGADFRRTPKRGW